MKSRLIFTACISLLAACTNHANELNHKREIFDAGGQEVITSSANQVKGIMTILYGNRNAEIAALNGSGVHKPGEIYTLTTWGQIGNPRWYGSNFSGRILSVESIIILKSAQGKLSVSYKLLKGSAPKEPNGEIINPQTRIDMIINRQPSVFP